MDASDHRIVYPSIGLTPAAGAAAVCAYRDVSAIKFSGGLARSFDEAVERGIGGCALQ
jgi:hypothetical protein